MHKGSCRCGAVSFEVDGPLPVTRISDYVKLRLEPSKLAAWAADAGLTVEGVSEEGGLVTLDQILLYMRRSPVARPRSCACVRWS